MPIIYRKYVNHPGTKAQPYLRPAFSIGKKVLAEQLSSIFSKKRRKLKSGEELAHLVDISCAKAAQATAQVAKRLAPVRTGNLKRSIFARQVSTFEYSVGTNVVYAAAVEFGLPARKIVPVRAEVLKFFVKKDKSKVRKKKKKKGKRRKGKRRKGKRRKAS